MQCQTDQIQPKAFEFLWCALGGFGGAGVVFDKFGIMQGLNLIRLEYVLIVYGLGRSEPPQNEGFFEIGFK